MSASLGSSDRCFDGLRRRNVERLLDLLSGATVRDVEYLRTRYSDHATDFDSTVEGLLHLGIITKERASIAIDESVLIQGGNKRQFGHWLLSCVVAQEKFARRLFGYLAAFRFVDGRLAWNPGSASGSHYSDVRDVLMEIEAVRIDLESGEYTLSSEYGYLFGLLLERERPVSPAAFLRDRQSKDDLGRSVELAVCQYERQRLGEAHSSRVVHTAAIDVSAGYDITSVTVCEGYVVPRYIEVKAVSCADYNFFWTANEIQVAAALARFYFLYLVPVTCDRPRLDDVLIIQNPCEQVFSADGQWTVTDNVVSCRLADPPAPPRTAQ